MTQLIKLVTTQLIRRHLGILAFETAFKLSEKGLKSIFFTEALQTLFQKITCLFLPY